MKCSSCGKQMELLCPYCGSDEPQVEMVEKHKVVRSFVFGAGLNDETAVNALLDEGYIVHSSHVVRNESVAIIEYVVKKMVEANTN